ncbi:TolC family protein [bacterium]|nr:TolC family protein [bacterium]
MRTGMFILCVLIFQNTVHGEFWTEEDAVQAAYHSNPEIERINQTLIETKAEARASSAFKSPSLFMEYDGIPSGGGLGDYDERKIGLSQELEFPLRYLWISKIGKSRIKQSNNQAQADKLSLEMKVRRSYLNTWALSEKLEILKSYTASLDSQATALQRMAEVGKISQLDSKRAQAERQEALQEMKLTELLLAAERSKLQKFTGIESFPDSLAMPSISKSSQTQYSFSAVTNLNWRSKSYSLEQEKIVHTLTATSWLPAIELTGFQKHLQFEPDPEFWGIEVGLAVPLWFWWGGVADMQVSKARVRQAKAELASLQIDTESMWEQQYAIYEAALSRHEAYGNILLPTSEEVARIARRSYELGQSDFLDVLEAQRSLFQRQLDFIDTAVQLHESRIELDKLQGRSLLAEVTKMSGE